MAKTIGSLLLRIISIFVFAAVAGVTLFFAYGYRYDLEERVVQKTSIIDITSKIADVAVFLDGQKVADTLPFQIKGVLPGSHGISLEKEGFLPWKRDVKVKEDIVTIVYDALPLPDSLDEFFTEKLTFGEGEKVFYGDNYILSYLPGERSISISNLFKNGKVSTEEISLYREDFNILELFPGEKFLIGFEDKLGVRTDDLYAYVSFSDREFKLFALPKGVEKIRVDGDADFVVFLKEGDLYSAGFGKLSEDGYDYLEEFLIAGGVSRFEPDYEGNVFYLSEGMLYRSWLNGEGLALIDDCPDCYENLAVHDKNGYRMLVLRGADGVRKLYMLNRGAMQILTADLKGYPFVNGRNEVIYRDGSGNVIVYDIAEKKKIIAAVEDEEAEILGWYGDEGHYLAMKGENLLMYDIFGVEPVLIFEKFDFANSIINGRSLYVTRGDSLMSLYFDYAYAE